MLFRNTRAQGRRTLGLLVLGSLLVAGCDSALRIRPDVQLPPKSVVIFFPDGMDLARTEAMLAAGELPTIKRVFVDGGVQVKGAVSSLPSITYPNCASLITGVFPGHHGITGNFWFDRERLLTRYYMTFGTYRTVNDHFTAPTLYDLLSDHFTLNIQGHTRRGVTATIDNQAAFGLAWALGRYVYADHRAGMSFFSADEIANHVKRWPSVIMTYYPAVDEIGHRHGSHSAIYCDTLRDIDETVERITTAIERAGLSDRTYFVLATDHSHVPTPDKHSDMRRFIIEMRGLRLRSRPLWSQDYATRFETLQDYDVVGGVDEDRAVMFHLRGKSGWTQRPSHEEVEAWVTQAPAFTDVPGVQFAIVRAGADRVHVLSCRGTLFVERRIQDGRREYRVVPESGDPLGYQAIPALAAFVESGWHESREWLRATIDTENPDFVAQVVDMFDSPRTGDVVLFAANGWSFDPMQKGGHGSCLYCDMKIPLFFAGPDLPKGAAIGPGRLVDIMPTIVGLLGEGRRLENVALDGIDLSDNLKRAAAPPSGL